MYASNDGKYYMQVEGTALTGDQILDYINQEGEAGWELISVVQKIGNEIFYDPKAQKKAEKSAGEILGNLFTGMMAGPVVTPSTQHRAATIGYWFWFKRTKE